MGTVKRITSAGLLRSVLIGLSALGAVALLANLALALWAQNEFTQPESIVAGQSRMLERTGQLYYGLKDYPYTVCAYMPLGYSIQASLQALGMPPYQAGRVVSFAALCALIWLIYQTLQLYSGDRRCAWLGAALCGCTAGLPFWGTAGQVDMLAVTLSFGAFHQFSRFWVTGAHSLRWAILLTVLAIFTKQTVVAAPAAIALALWLRDRKPAIAYAAASGGAGLALVWMTNRATNGSFLLNTVFANINPFAWEKIEQHAGYWLIASAQLGVIAAVGAHRLWDKQFRPVALYALLSLAVLAVTAGKLGSDSNYQLESTAVLVVAACLSLHALGFFDLVFTKTKSWAPLLIMPLLIHAVLNLRLETANLMGRHAKDHHFRSQIASLAQHIGRDDRVLSADTNALIHLGRRIEVEPLIYRLLAEAGRIDPEPLRADLANRVFSTVILYHDVSRTAKLHAEIPTLTREQLAAIQSNYRRVGHVPGPYAGGLHVYKPLPPGKLP